MSPATNADRELDSLIAEITIDCHDEYEALSAFENAFDEDANFPFPGTVVGEDVEVLPDDPHAADDVAGYCSSRHGQAPRLWPPRA